MVLLSFVFVSLFEQAGSAYLFQEADSRRGPWWLLGLLIGVGLLSWLISWLMRRDDDTIDEAAASGIAVESPLAEFQGDMVIDTAVKPAAAADATLDKSDDLPETPAQPDDLTRMEGIGPKVATILNDKGIFTFNQLAHTDVDKLTEILNQANLPMLNPVTWPDQARLAAMGDWAGLSVLQNELKGGRKIG